MCLIELCITIGMIQVKIQDICSYSGVFWRNFQYEYNFPVFVLPTFRTKKLSGSRNKRKAWLILVNKMVGPTAILSLAVAKELRNTHCFQFSGHSRQIWPKINSSLTLVHFSCSRIRGLSSKSQRRDEAEINASRNQFRFEFAFRVLAMNYLLNY